MIRYVTAVDVQSVANAHTVMLHLQPAFPHSSCPHSVIKLDALQYECPLLLQFKQVSDSRIYELS